MVHETMKQTIVPCIMWKPLKKNLWSTDHAIAQFAHQIQMLNKNIYTLGVFIDLSKTFDKCFRQICKNA